MEETQRDTGPLRGTRRGGLPRQNGMAIRALREASGLSQLQFAAAAGIRQGTLSAIETETASASAITIRKIARQLAVPPGAITRDREDAPGAEAGADPEPADAAA